MLSEKEVRHVAKLARIELTDSEVKKFSGQLSGVLDYMDILKEVDTEGVEETSQVTGLQNVLGADEVVAGRCKREELLECSELPVDDKQIRVLPAIK
ncbi:MAG: Asp-tRNA(Asn)/Glu-tRNA(Gln) amidotransferase subunit GatC [Nitrospirota bacterium]